MKLVSFCLCASFIFASAAYGDEGEKISHLEAQIHDLQRELQDVKEQLRDFKREEPRQIKEGCGFFIVPDIFYWNVRENGLSYALENDGSTTIADHADLKDPRFQWNLGFKFGIGYNFKHDCWDLFLNFTHIHVKGRSNADASGDKVLFPIWTNAATQTTPDDVSTIRGKWRLHFGMVDLELGRRFGVTKWLSLRPFIGLKQAEIRQKYIFLYQGGTLFPEGEDRLSMKNKFWGIGPMAGLDTLWGLGYGLSIYGNAAISLLYGLFHVHENETATVGLEDRLSLFHRFTLARAVTDLMLGLCWEYFFCRDRFRLVLTAGWDQHLFFGQNQFYRFVNPQMQGAVVGNQGDLSLQGWTWGLRFDF